MVVKGTKGLKVAFFAIVALLIGTGAVFAVARTAPEVTPDTVAALNPSG